MTNNLPNQPTPEQVREGAEELIKEFSKMKPTKILVLSNVQGRFYLKTIEECSSVTHRNAQEAGFVIVSRKDKGITESLTERNYGSAAEAKGAAAKAGVKALTYQFLATQARVNR